MIIRILVFTGITVKGFNGSIKSYGVISTLIMKSTISADIIKSSSLDKFMVIELQDHLRKYVDLVEQSFPDCWGRIVRGDSIELVVPNARLAFRLAIMLKCHVKAFGVKFSGHSNQLTFNQAKFFKYGVRIAIGFGSLKINDLENGIIDGNAIYASGRTLDGMSSRMRKNFVVAGLTGGRERLVQAILGLVDELLSHATAKQCEVVFMRLLGHTENEIAKIKAITQVAVNAHLRRAGWYAIENAIATCEEILI